MEPTLVPLNEEFSSYHVLLPLKDKEYGFSVHNISPAEDSLRNARLEFGEELQSILTDYELLIREKLFGSVDLLTFVQDFKSILERSVQTQQGVSLPFYSQLCSNLDALGWDCLTWISDDLSSLHFKILDNAGREHIVKVDVSPQFPAVLPKTSANLPVPVKLRSRHSDSFKKIVSQYEAVIERYQDFWEVMDDLDRSVWVLEPDHPSRADVSRRIALGGHCSLSVVVDPLSPRSVPECSFFGSDSVISPLRKRLNARIWNWDHNKLLIANLEDVLDLKFPSAKDADNEDVNADCGICYAYRAPDGAKKGGIPDRVCDNANCGRPFHTACLVDWLRSISTTRQSFDVLFGQCPYCSHPIAVKKVYN